MTSKELFWIFLVETTKKDELKKLQKKIEESIGKYQILEEEIYWKNEAYYRVEIKQTLNQIDSISILESTFNKCSFLSPSWHFVLPKSFDSISSNLSAISETQIYISPIKWINLEMRNLSN